MKKKIPSGGARTYEDGGFVNCYTQSHYRDVIRSYLQKNPEAKKNDRTQFFRMPLKNYYEEITRFFLDGEGRAELALDLGCSVGRSTMELAKYAKNVIGVDPSFAQISVAKSIAAKKKITVTIGQSRFPYPRNGVTLEIPVKVKSENVEFIVGDDAAISSMPHTFDAVCSLAVIDRVKDLRAFLRNIKKRMRPGSLLLLSTPFDWDRAYTPEKNWLGTGAYGTKKGLPEAALKELLRRFGFVRVREKNFLWPTLIDSRSHVIWSVYAGVFRLED